MGREFDSPIPHAYIDSVRGPTYSDFVQKNSVALNLAALLLTLGALAFLISATPLSEREANAPLPVAASTTPSTAAATTTPPPANTALKKAPPPPVAAPYQTAAAAERSPGANPASTQVVRLQNPYSTPPESSDAINTQARAALVNILCLSSGSVRPISGSGVIIDPRGVILTNAHVAQYVLLSENPAVNLSCAIRGGSPARDMWGASVLFIPPAWVAEHVKELNTQDQRGTGEHDYALLLIDRAVPGGALPVQFPYLPPDTRQAIGFTGDAVLVASYPAEFLAGPQAESSLYAYTSLTTIGQLLTYDTNTVDALSLGGVIEAQSGSSGGSVTNPWGRLIGLIATVSEGTTTASRDLRAITLSYINGDIRTQSGSDLATYLQGDLAARLQDFNTNTLPGLMAQYIKRLQSGQY